MYDLKLSSWKQMILIERCYQAIIGSLPLLGLEWLGILGLTTTAASIIRTRTAPAPQSELSHSMSDLHEQMCPIRFQYSWICDMVIIDAALKVSIQIEVSKLTMEEGHYGDKLVHLLF